MGKGYRTVLVDPPWDYGADHKRWPTAPRAGIKRDAIPYSAMSTAEIAALPIGELAELDARVFLWTTNRFLPESFGILEGWGFDYRQMLVWHKLGASPFGGSVAPNHAEFLLVGVRGAIDVTERGKNSVITTSKLAHSQKPDAFIDLIEQVSPGPYLELFARRQRLGWDTWGNQCYQGVAI